MSAELFMGITILLAACLVFISVSMFTVIVMWIRETKRKRGDD